MSQPDPRLAVVLRVLTTAKFPDGGRVVSDNDALVLANRIVAALASSPGGDPDA